MEIKNPLRNAKIVGVNVSPSSYHAIKQKRGDAGYIMSHSELSAFAPNAHKWIAGFRDESSDAQEWGTLRDIQVLQPDSLADRVIEQPQEYPDMKGVLKPWSNNANFCKDWNRQQQDAGKLVVKSKLMESAKAATTILFEDEIAAEFIRCSQHQVEWSAEYYDRETKLTIPLRGLIDIVPDKDHWAFGKCIADFKTAANASHRKWQKDVFAFGYHRQAALYLDAYTLATGEDRCDFRHLIQESDAPFEIGRRIVSEEFIQIGRMEYLAALQAYCRCLSENHWPSYDTHGNYSGWSLVQPEAWILKELAARESTTPKYSPPTQPDLDQEVCP